MKSTQDLVPHIRHPREGRNANLLAESSVNKRDSWQMFDKIARQYDFLNRLLSFGIDAGWRSNVAKYLPQGEDLLLIDVATGTGDLAISLVKANPRIKSAIGIDMSEKMLEIGSAKVKKLKLDYKVRMELGDACSLSAADNSFDVATMAFGIRNVEHPVKALSEIYRVLRPNGTAIILEFSLPKNVLVRCGYLIYLRYILPFIGGIVSGDKNAYVYLNRTIESFPYGEQFILLMKEAGFSDAKFDVRSFGVAHIYYGQKN